MCKEKNIQSYNTNIHVWYTHVQAMGCIERYGQDCHCLHEYMPALLVKPTRNRSRSLISNAMAGPFRSVVLWPCPNVVKWLLGNLQPNFGSIWTLPKFKQMQWHVVLLLVALVKQLNGNEPYSSSAKHRKDKFSILESGFPPPKV